MLLGARKSVQVISHVVAGKQGCSVLRLHASVADASYNRENVGILGCCHIAAQETFGCYQVILLCNTCSGSSD